MLVVVVVSKFTIGAWIPAVVIPIIVVILERIGRHYDRVQTAIEVPDGWKPKRHQHSVVVLVGNMNIGVLEAVNYARSLAPDRLIAVSVVGDPAEQDALAQGLGGARHPGRAAHDLLALPGADPTRSSTTSTSSTPRTPTT